AGEDYTSTSGMLTFDPGDTEQTITVPILDDQSYGNARRFNVELSSPSGADLGTDALAQVTISNDEAVPTATIEDVSVAESAGTMTLTLRLSHPSELATRYWALASGVGGTATEGTDYESFITGSNRFFTVPAGDLSATLDITILDDDVPESDETITIPWNRDVTNVTPSTILFTGTILNDDASNSPATGKPTISGTARVGETLTASTSGISDADGTAGAGFSYQWVRVDSDGTSNPANVGTGGSTYTLAAADEGRRIKVEVSFTDDRGHPEGPLESDPTATVAPPLPSVRFGAASYAAIEGGADARVTLELSAAQQAALTVPLTVTHQGGATSADYSGVPPSVTFQPGRTQVSFTVTATDDGVDDDGERLRLDIGGLPSGVTRGSPSTAVVALVQEEVTVWYIYFSHPTYTATEGGADAELTVVLSAPWKPELNEALTIGLSAPEHQGGATAADYSGVPESVTFAPGQTRESFTVTATDDGENDDGESFRLGFAAVSGNFPEGLRTGRGPHIVTVHLKDNDEPRTVSVAFGARTYTAAEGGATARVAVRLSAAPGRAVTVPLTKRHNGASAADYDGVPASVSFAANETSKTFDVTAIDDAVDDDGESVTLGFGELPTSLSAGDPATTTVNLTDNDGESKVRTLTMGAANTRINELPEGQSHNLTFLLDEAVEDAVSVPLEVEHTGGATAADYTGVPATITFERGEHRTNVVVRAVQDAEDDDGEGFKVSFGTLPPGLKVDEQYSVATFMIIDDDGLPGLSVDAIDSEYESAGHLGFEVKLSEKAEQEVRVDYATRDGTAKAGQDYRRRSGTLVFWEGQEFKRVWVPLIDDKNVEDTETFTLRLSNPVRAVLLNDTAVGRILDNDASGSMSSADGEDGDGALLDLVRGVTVEAAAAALLGADGLTSGQLDALDWLGNGNGRYDLGDMLSWRDRCRRGEADCGRTSGDAGGAAGAAALLGAAWGRRASGRGGGRAPRPRARTRVRRGRRRARYAAGVLLAATAALSCGDGAGGPVGPAAAVPDPGFVTVELAAPAAHRDIGVLLELEGPGIEAVRAPGLEVYESGASGRRRVILAGPVEAGPLMQFHVPDRNRLALYRVRVVEVTGEDYGLRDAGEYRTVLRPR
ncbi:MAG: hypothetical protein F4Z50_12110, partial [Gemmatimonadetes bacterium]|nr:hypothetical protein [Gemmatimonadota bacterium]